MKPIKAVLFDLDETLFDHSYCVAYSMEIMRLDHASLQSKSLDEILQEHRRILELNHLDVMAGRLDARQARIDRLRGIFHFCGATVSEDLIAQAATLHRERYLAAQRAISGAVDLLRALKRHTRIAIVTNNFLDEQRRKLEVCGLSPLIDLLITSEEVGRAKPDPEIFRVALQRLGCTPEEAVMVGDSWEVDIIGARNAGIRAVWFNRDGLHPSSGEAVEEIASFKSTESVVQLLLGTER